MYKDLLVAKRIRPSSRGERPLMEEVESDRARVLYSASFRRLQRKTQVFPLEENAAVRTRLTHSLEVAHVGRFLASKVIELLRDRGQLDAFELDAEVQHALTVTVEVACLLHDIGNPAFGHFGEVAISRWFQNNYDKDSRFDDLKTFDGNPQGFRIVSRLNGADGQSGMNLTLSQLAATMKYQSVLPEKKKFKKYGVFETERAVMNQVREQFGLNSEQRFPLAYLMEAADDISYCLSDIEDAAEKNLIDHDVFVRELGGSISGDAARMVEKAAEFAEKNREKIEKPIAFRSNLISQLVEYAATVYVEQHDEIIQGVPKELISKESGAGRLLGAVKDVVRRTVYSDKGIQSLELAGLSVMTALLDHFGELLKLSREQFSEVLETGSRPQGLDVEKRLAEFIAPKHKNVYRISTNGLDKDGEMRHRAHLVVDYVSGMTDPFALKMHQTLGGMRL